MVDDERDIIIVLKKGLEKFGFNVDAFDDPLVALSNFKANYYDIGLLDIKMPNMSGFELYEKLNVMDSNMKFCFMTAFEVYEQEFQKMFPNLDIRLIRKPVRLSQLVDILEKDSTRAK